MALVVRLSLLGDLCKVKSLKSLHITDRAEGSSSQRGLKSRTLRMAPDLLGRKCKPLQKI